MSKFNWVNKLLCNFFYPCHLSNEDVFWRIKACIALLSWYDSLKRHPFPSNNSLVTLSSSSSSHTRRLTFLKSFIYYVQNPMASCIEYPSDMLPSGFSLVRTFFFKTFIYHSIGYIHLILTRPQCSSSYCRYIKRCIEMLKIVGGNSRSNRKKDFNNLLPQTIKFQRI